MSSCSILKSRYKKKTCVTKIILTKLFHSRRGRKAETTEYISFLRNVALFSWL